MESGNVARIRACSGCAPHLAQEVDDADDERAVGHVHADDLIP